MGQFTRREVVLIRFPFSDLSQTKLRPALVLVEVEYGDVLLCQITSKDYGQRNAVELKKEDFESGSLPQSSYARPGRLLTADPALITRSLGMILEAKHAEVVAAITELLG